MEDGLEHTYKDERAVAEEMGEEETEMFWTTAWVWDSGDRRDKDNIFF